MSSNQFEDFKIKDASWCHDTIGILRQYTQWLATHYQVVLQLFNTVILPQMHLTPHSIIQQYGPVDQHVERFTQAFEQFDNLVKGRMQYYHANIDDTVKRFYNDDLKAPVDEAYALEIKVKNIRLVVAEVCINRYVGETVVVRMTNCQRSFWDNLETT